MGARMSGNSCALGKGNCMGRKYLGAKGVAMEPAWTTRGNRRPGVPVALNEARAHPHSDPMILLFAWFLIAVLPAVARPRPTPWSSPAGTSEPRWRHTRPAIVARVLKRANPKYDEPTSARW